jgi:hypothetical protein
MNRRSPDPTGSPSGDEAIRSFINRDFPKQGEKSDPWDLRRIVEIKL